MFKQIFNHPPSVTFLQLQQKKYSYQWLQDKIKRLSSLFAQLNIKTGDKLVLAISDESEFAAIFLSALANGITTVTLDPETRMSRASAIIERVSPRLIIANEKTLQSWRLNFDASIQILSWKKDIQASAGLLGKFLQKNKPSVAENDYLNTLSKAVPTGQIPDSIDPETIAYIIFTSGTTAASKGVAISHANLSAHLSTLKKVYSLTEDSVILNQLLLWHADGCIQGPVLAAYAGCTWHNPFVFSIDKIHSLLDYGYANDVSHWFVVPAMLNLLVSFSEGYEDSFKYPAFKALISVSAHLESPLWNKVENIFNVRICNVYGLTETVAGSLFCGPLPETYKKLTAGKPVDTEIRIVNDNGEAVSPGETGELLLKGAHIMKNYFNDPETTAKSFSNGWFLTGDFASADEDGFITIKGRKKNLIISGGFNIQPEEVTECLLRNEAVQEACALGLHDEIFGEKLVAAVILKPQSNITSAELVEHCRHWLEEKKIPQKIYIVDSLPKGVSGKVQLNELRSQLTKSAAQRTGVSEKVLDEVLAVASESFQIPMGKVTESDTSQTIDGWDSLAHLTFVTLLEERFNVRFSTAEVMTLNSIKKATQLVKDKNG